MAAIASGRFERNTAASTATLTPAPSSSPSPITADSGMPSRTIPSTIASAEPAPAVPPHLLAPLAAHPVDERVADEEGQRAGGEPEREAAAPRRGLEGLRYELVGDGADQDAGAERHDQAEQPLPDRQHERQSAAEDQRRAGEEAPEERAPHADGIVPAAARRVESPDPHDDPDARARGWRRPGAPPALDSLRRLKMLLAADYPFLDVLWTMLVFFLWIGWFMLLFHVIGDVFRRRDAAAGRRRSG